VVRENEEAVRWAREKGMVSLEAGALSLLARAAAMRDDFPEARRLNRMAERLIPDLGELRALVLANRGELEEAVRLAREAVDMALRSEQVNSQADAYFDLGVVLRAAGRPDEAIRAATRARELFEEKGNLVQSGRAQDWLEAASPA